MQANRRLQLCQIVKASGSVVELVLRDKIHDDTCNASGVDDDLKHKHDLDDESLADSQAGDLPFGEPRESVVEDTRQDNRGNEWKQRQGSHQIEPTCAA